MPRVYHHQGGNMVAHAHTSPRVCRVLIGLAVLWGIIGLSGGGSWVSGRNRAKTYGKDLGCPLRTVGFGFGLSLPPPFC